MELVYTWVKNIVCFYIFMNIIIHLLPKDSYRKYVRFFSGMLLMILVATPVLSVLGQEEVLMQKISQAGFFQELDNIKLDTAHLEQTQKKAYLQEYERAIEMDIERIAQGKGLNPLRTEARLSEDYQVESIVLEVSDSKEGVLVPKVSFGDDSLKHPGADELKQELMEFYRLEENRITVSVQ
ncbi:MAG: stage III sporulation protein AF [Lachnospiraceae bacterium]|jgi:stage III sporulation protein AF|nr:stage III sporulation protein AF [Lachnospiraceae bacterium]